MSFLEPAGSILRPSLFSLSCAGTKRLSTTRPSATGVGIGSESGDEESRVSYRVDPNLPCVAGLLCPCLSTELPRFTAPCKADPRFTDVCAPRTPSASDAYAVGRGSAPCLALRRSTPAVHPRPPSAKAIVYRPAAPSSLSHPAPTFVYPAHPHAMAEGALPRIVPLSRYVGSSTVSSSTFPWNMCLLLPMPSPLPLPPAPRQRGSHSRSPRAMARTHHLLLAPVERTHHPLRIGCGCGGAA
ncbi:hypothetical protein DFH09DRAFT_1320584 [Mycena vulgaris]|nr:hypothetical protein DFH09DRAFT_1320584 [Mycena vulgaris]